MIGYDIYGGFLDTETVAVTRAVTWVPRSCHGSDLGPHRDVRIEGRNIASCVRTAAFRHVLHRQEQTAGRPCAHKSD